MYKQRTNSLPRNGNLLIKQQDVVESGVVPKFQGNYGYNYESPIIEQGTTIIQYQQLPQQNRKQNNKTIIKRLVGIKSPEYMSEASSPQMTPQNLPKMEPTALTSKRSPYLQSQQPYNFQAQSSNPAQPYLQGNTGQITSTLKDNQGPNFQENSFRDAEPKFSKNNQNFLNVSNEGSNGTSRLGYQQISQQNVSQTTANKQIASKQNNGKFNLRNIIQGLDPMPMSSTNNTGNNTSMNNSFQRAKLREINDNSFFNKQPLKSNRIMDDMPQMKNNFDQNSIMKDTNLSLANFSQGQAGGAAGGNHISNFQNLKNFNEDENVINMTNSSKLLNSEKLPPAGNGNNLTPINQNPSRRLNSKRYPPSMQRKSYRENGLPTLKAGKTPSQNIPINQGNNFYPNLNNVNTTNSVNNSNLNNSLNYNINGNNGNFNINTQTYNNPNNNVNGNNLGGNEEFNLNIIKYSINKRQLSSRPGYNNGVNIYQQSEQLHKLRELTQPNIYSDQIKLMRNLNSTTPIGSQQDLNQSKDNIRAQLSPINIDAINRTVDMKQSRSQTKRDKNQKFQHNNRQYNEVPPNSNQNNYTTNQTKQEDNGSTIDKAEAEKILQGNFNDNINNIIVNNQSNNINIESGIAIDENDQLKPQSDQQCPEPVLKNQSQLKSPSIDPRLTQTENQLIIHRNLSKPEDQEISNQKIAAVNFNQPEEIYQETLENNSKIMSKPDDQQMSTKQEEENQINGNNSQIIKERVFQNLEQQQVIIPKLVDQDTLGLDSQRRPHVGNQQGSSSQAETVRNLIKRSETLKLDQIQQTKVVLKKEEQTLSPMALGSSDQMVQSENKFFQPSTLKDISGQIIQEQELRKQGILSAYTPQLSEYNSNGKISQMSMGNQLPHSSLSNPNYPREVQKTQKNFINNQIDENFFRANNNESPTESSTKASNLENRVSESVVQMTREGETMFSPSPSPSNISQSPTPIIGINNSMAVNSVGGSILKKIPEAQLPIPIQILVRIETSLINLSRALRGEGGNLLEICHDYIETTWQSKALDNLQQGFKDEQTRKIIRSCFVLERLSIVIIVHCFLDQKILQANLANLRNVVQYCHHNFISAVDLVLSQIPAIAAITGNSTQNRASSSTIQLEELIPSVNERIWLISLKEASAQNFLKINKKPINKTDLVHQIKQNNEMIINLYKTASQNDKEFYNFLTNYMKHIQQNSVRQNYNQLLDYFALFLTIQENILGPGVRIPFLSVAPAPYLPDIKPSRRFTLILDLDETLVHYSEINGGGQFVVRPYCHSFLGEMSEYYEIVIFTAAMPDYANWVLDNIDQNQFITHRLFRQHASQNGSQFIKDISRIGRDLSTEIIIDNVAENFQLQPQNGIFIQPWFNDPTDTALAQLTPLLQEIAVQNVPDVRQALRKLQQQMIDNINRGVQFPHLNLQLD